MMSSSFAVSTVDNAVGLHMKKSTVMLVSNSAYFEHRPGNYGQYGSDEMVS